ncbi:MAG: hypothetical protein Q8O38_17230 [Sulfurimicrobium sp.]|nr:hypothetical protein [Sulfurimicrobium sp.]
MKKILTILFLAGGIAAMPVVHAADEVPPADQKKDQKAAGEDKDKKAGEEGKKKGEKKGEGGAEPECN